jgi:hypothetical protein
METVAERDFWLNKLAYSRRKYAKAHSQLQEAKRKIANLNERATKAEARVRQMEAIAFFEEGEKVDA